MSTWEFILGYFILAPFGAAVGALTIGLILSLIYLLWASAGNALRKDNIIWRVVKSSFFGFILTQFIPNLSINMSGESSPEEQLYIKFLLGFFLVLISPVIFDFSKIISKIEEAKTF